MCWRKDACRFHRSGLVIAAGLVLLGACRGSKGSPKSGEPSAGAGGTQTAGSRARSEPGIVSLQPGPEVLSVAGLRAKVATSGVLQFAGVVTATPEVGLRCLETQATHGQSCPPPYYVVGDAAPFHGRVPEVLGDRVLVELSPQAELRVGRMYVFQGRWCFDRNLAKFCGRVLGVVPDEAARAFWTRHSGKSGPVRASSKGG